MATGDWERVGGEREKNQRKVWWAERETHEEVHSPPFLSPLHFHITLSSSLYHPSVLLPQRSLLLSSFSSFFFCKLQTSAASTAPPFFHSSGKAFNPLSRTSVCITTVCFCRRLTVIYPLLHFFFIYKEYIEKHVAVTEEMDELLDLWLHPNSLLVTMYCQDYHAHTLQYRLVDNV